MRIATNVEAMVGTHQLENITNRKALAVRQLSSGDRIVSANVDPAGLAISENMKSTLRCQDQAKRNANDAVSILQVAESTLSTSSALAIRLRELALQSATDSVSDSDRMVINKDFLACKNEIIRTVRNAQYNGKDVLYDNPQNYDFQVGTGHHDVDRVVYK
ncbi:MAG: flagellin FliC, partial [Pseudomonadota bacterium]